MYRFATQSQNLTSEKLLQIQNTGRLRYPAKKKVSASAEISAVEILIGKLSNLNNTEHLFYLGAVPHNQIQSSLLSICIISSKRWG